MERTKLTPLGKALRKLRISRGELLKDMADKMGISSVQMSSIEHGRFENIESLYAFMIKLKKVYCLSDMEFENLVSADPGLYSVYQKRQVEKLSTFWGWDSKQHVRTGGNSANILFDDASTISTTISPSSVILKKNGR